MRRSHDDRFPVPLWETWFCPILGVPIPALVANPDQCSCRLFRFDPCGDHLQTCQHQSAALPTHEWIAYSLSSMLRSVGHRVVIHKVAPAVGNERGDVEIKDYVVLPRGEASDNRLPRHALILDVTMTHDRDATLHTNGKLTHTISSNDDPQPDGAIISWASTDGRALVAQGRGFKSCSFLA